MKKTLIFILLLSNALLLLSQSKENEISDLKYIQAYNYLSNDSILKNEVLEVSNKIAPLYFSFFIDFFTTEGDDQYSVHRELERISFLPCNDSIINIGNINKSSCNPTALVFFSKTYKNTIIAEVFRIDRKTREYKEMKPFNSSYIFLFVFNGNILEKVLRKEIAYD